PPDRERGPAGSRPRWSGPERWQEPSRGWSVPSRQHPPRKGRSPLPAHPFAAFFLGQLASETRKSSLGTPNRSTCGTAVFRGQGLLNGADSAMMSLFLGLAEDSWP